MKKIVKVLLLAGIALSSFTFAFIPVYAVDNDDPSYFYQNSGESNDIGFLTDDYDLKNVEEEEKDFYQNYDKTGPILEVTNEHETQDAIQESAHNDTLSSEGREKYIIVIDPGHGDNHGASGNGIKEDEVVLEIGKELQKLLKDDSRFEVYMTRSSDVFVENEERPAFSNSKNADCFLSIHLNSSDSSSASGTETWYNSESDTKTKEGLDNKNYAKIIQTYLQKATGFKDRGLHTNNWTVLCNNNAASALAEVGFLSNRAEANKLKVNAKKYANGLYQAFINIADSYPKRVMKTQNTEVSSSNLNASLTSDVSLKNVASSEKVVNKGKFVEQDGDGYTGVYTIAGRSYKVYAQSKDSSAWSVSHGCSAAVLATILSSAGYDYDGDDIHDGSAKDKFSTKAAIKKYGITSGDNSDYDAFNRDMPMTCFGLSAVMRNLGLSCNYVATWKTDEDAINNITAALSSGKCVAVYVDSTKRNGIQLTTGRHCILLVGFKKNGTVNFLNPAGGRLNYSHLTGNVNNLKLEDLVKYYMFKNTEKANQVVYNKNERSGGYVIY